MNAELRNALGFAMKAGKVASGEFTVDKAVKRFKAKAVVLDCEASENTKKRWQDACALRSIPIIFVADMGSAIGKEARMVAAILDSGFAAMVLKAAAKTESK